MKGRYCRREEHDTKTSSKKPLLIGIAGGSASGKSTFAHTLVERISNDNPTLNIRTISTDQYFHHDFSQIPTYESPAFHTDLPDFNHPAALDIPQLLSDLENIQQEENSVDVVLLEGHLLFHFAGSAQPIGCAHFH